MEEEATWERGEAVADAYSLTQAPVIDTSAPPQGGRETYSGAQVEYNKSGTPEGEGA